MNNIKKVMTCMALLATGAAANAAEGDAYSWPEYNPTCNYNFKAQGITYTMPTQNYAGDCYNSRSGESHKDWWSFVWGPTRNPCVSDLAISNLLDYFNQEFNYITDTMGWPRDRRVQDGYRSTVYLYGSLACTGSTDSTEKGGWQTIIDGYPAVDASYYPVYSYDPSCPYSDRVSQMDAMIHEGVHCILTDLGASHVHWFQECGNTWLQQEMAVKRHATYSGMGFLNAVPLICPFMPIECYSGWLLDGSFGGPGAQGVGANPTCNWRTMLGGSQYSNIFPTFLGLWLSEGAVPWIWVNTTNSSKYILETMGDHMGDAQIRRLIMEYRAKMCMLDMKGWSSEMRNLINQNFGSSLGCECSSWSGWSCSQSADAWWCSPYVVTTTSGNTITPESTTTPGWSGANFIPLKSNGKGSTAKVGFTQIGDNMTLQLCYRGTDGVPVYSEPVYGSGTAVLNITTEPQDGLVFAVVCNTDYAYKGEETRTKHHDYRLTMESGITGTADPHTAWYNDFELTYDWASVSHTTTVDQATDDTQSQETTTMDIDTLVYNVELPQGLQYKSTNVVLDADKIADLLGTTVSYMKSNIGNDIKFYGVNLNGSTYTSYTANDPGYWFAANGNVCEWSNANSSIFAELNTTDMSVNVGQYSDETTCRLSVGNQYTVTECFQLGTKQVNITFNVTITDPTSTAVKSPYVYENSRQRQLTTWYENGVVAANYTVPNEGDVKLSLYNANSALIEHLTNERKAAGTYRYDIDFKAMNLPKGIYLLHYQFPGHSETQMVVAK